MNKRFFAIASTMLCVACGTAPAAPAAAPKPGVRLEKISDTQVLKWKHGKQAVFFLAFDDACPSHLKNVIPELHKRKIPATFYPIAGNGMFRDQPAGAKEAKTPEVILGNHTFNHKDCTSVEQLDQELSMANDAINQRVAPASPTRLISYGQPGGVKWTLSKEEIQAALAKHNLVSRPPFWGAAIHVKTTEDIVKLVDAAIAKGEMGHLDFHGVGGDWLAASVEFLHAALDKLEAEQDKLWITDHLSYHKYLTERDASEVKVLASEPKQIRLQLHTTADPKLYDQPLTLATKVPADWRRVEVTQGKAKVTVAVVDGIVTYDALPGTQEITLHAAN